LDAHGTRVLLHFENDDYRSARQAAETRMKAAEIPGAASASELLTLRASSMSDRDVFGPRLRAERERRGISIETIASVTKVGSDLWEGLERNDFSRWPSGIFARAFVRDYARAIGLDSDEVVNEFCRIFPLGDRRGSRLIQAQAQLIGHDLTCAESGGLPTEGDRRAPRNGRNEAALRRARILSRSISTAVDASASLGLAGVVSLVTNIGFWPVAGMVTVMYYTAMTIAFGTSPGAKAVEAIQRRLPALFEVAQLQKV
jgi:transcriptional regulator with XRE-family HTH domain